MKLSFSHLAAAATAILLTFSSSSYACEIDCQVGVSKAFGDKYGPVYNTLFTSYWTPTTDIFKYSNDSVGTLDKAAVNAAVSSAAAALGTDFASSLSKTIQYAIFDKHVYRPFLGDCNNPFRVTQPPVGVNWTMDDCNKMDYLCGNPPAICHFFDEVKLRNYGYIWASLRGNCAGPYHSKLYAVAKAEVAKQITDATTAASVLAVVDKNIIGALLAFSDDCHSKFCAGTSCNAWDNDIKLLLLSYP